MKKLFLAALACLSTTASADALAQGSREYFVAHIAQNEAPRQLSEREDRYYRSVFRAIQREEWDEVEDLLEDRSDGLLHKVAYAQYYLHARSPRVELAQILEWLDGGQDLPMAAQLIRLGQTRGLEAEPILPRERDFSSVGNFPRRTRPSSINDGTMPAATRASILNAITNDDPDGPRR